jgi:hypothetical protein
MPDKRTHRGAHPDDAALFSTEKLAVLRSAVADLSLLLTRGYADKSALKLVGDRYGLRQRQRTAVMRSSCADANLEARLGRMLGRDALEGRVIGIDGYNVLITLESALAGGLLLRGRDGCLRDLASIHGTYRRVTETALALEHAGRFLEEGGAAGSLWLLDRPVSNSGRLKKLMEDLARENEWPWEVRLVTNPDAELKAWSGAAATSDGPVLDGCGPWINLAAAVVETRMQNAWIVDLGRDA